MECLLQLQPGWDTDVAEEHSILIFGQVKQY